MTSRSNKTPSTTSFLPVAYLELYAIHWDECHNQIPRPIPMEKVFPILQPWLEKHLGELAQFKTRLQFRQLINQSQTE
jgi:hypothetical protein